MRRSSLLCLLLFIAAHLHAETFRNPYRIPTTSDPSSVLVADFNGDGLPDIVYGDSSAAPAKLHVLLAQAGTGYVPAPTITLPTNVGTACRAFDTNKDGKLDIVCPYALTFNASLVVFLGNGDGTFAAPITTPLPMTGGNYFNPSLSLPADFNSDGIPDLIVVDVLNSIGYVMLGDGKGSFKLASKIGGYLPVMVADVNGDGKPDLLIQQSAAVMLGNGDGTFGPFKAYTQTFDYDLHCAYADMDGDSHLDAVCGYSEAPDGDIDGATHLIVLHGNPDGTFNPTPISDKVFGNHDTEYDGEGSFDFPLILRDLNGDGIPDIIAFAGDGFTVLLGQTGLTFSDPKHYAAGIPSIFPYYFIQQFVDIDGDGQIDIVSCGTNGVYISYGKRDGSFATAPAYEVAQVLGHATFADFNGDGVPDIAATGDTTVDISLGKGDGTFAPFTSIPNGGINFSTPLTALNAYIVHGDFNGDGKQDLLAIGSSSIYQYDLYLYLGHGDGTFAPLTKVANTSSVYPQFYNGKVADLNGDGRDDFLSSDTNSLVAPAVPNLYASLSNGDGTFRSVTSNLPVELVQGGVFDAAVSSPALADFNHDGKLDVVVGEITNAYILPGHGDGTFDTNGAILPIPSISGNSGQGTASVATGDFDGDGNQDVAVLYHLGNLPGALSGYVFTNGAAVFVYYGNGDGTFSAPVTAGLFTHHYSMISASDLNGDGLSDLILRANDVPYDPPSLSILHAKPGRTFASEVNYTVNTGLYELAALDVNRDGLPDLLIANNAVSGNTSSSVTVLINLGNTPVVSGTLKASPEPSTVGQPFTLSATLTPPTPGTLSGSVDFSIDGVDIGSAPLSANVAAFPVSTPLAIGTHTISATWLGDSTYAPVSLSGNHSVIGLPVTLSLTAVPNPVPVGQLVTIAESVNAVNNSDPAPTGSVTLTDNGALISTFNGGTLNFGEIRGFAPGGSHTLTMNYSGDEVHSAASTSTVLVVTPIASAVTLQSSPNPSTYGQTVTFSATITDNIDIQYHQILTSGTVTFSGLPTGPVTMPVPATPQGNSNTVTYTTGTLPAGTYTVTATFSGNSSLNPSSATIAQVVNPAATATALSVTPAPAYQFQTVTLSAHVTGVVGVPTGTVQFLDGGTPLATVPLASGNATFATAVLAPGTHSLTAIYSGDSNNLTSTAAIAGTILPSDFTLSIDPAALTLVTGHHTTITLNVTSVGALSDTIQLSVGKVPLYTTVAFTPTSVKLPQNGQVISKVYIDTDAVLGYMSRVQPRPNSLRFFSSRFAPALALLLLPLIRRRSRRIPTLLAAFISATILLASSGCSSLYPSSTAPGTYPIQITGTGAQTHIIHSIILPLTVTE